MSTKLNSSELLSRIAIYEAEESLPPDHIRPDNVQERQENGLGIALARFCDWDGLPLLRIFHWALEDANYHAEAAQVWEMILKEEARQEEYEQDGE